jgi:RimJ/RimL family protein N-acetyltransferase
MSIRGKAVILRAIEEIDLPALHRWGNDPDLWHLLGGWHFPTSMAQTKTWFEGLQRDERNQRWAIEAPELGLVGIANLVEIDWKNNHAFHGMMLGDPSSRGKGIGVDAIMAVMRYAFDELHLVRLDGSMIEYNSASLHVYCDKCAWKIEGRQQDWFFRKGRYWQRVLVGITRGAYDQLIEKTRYWDT